MEVQSDVLSNEDGYIDLKSIKINYEALRTISKDIMQKFCLAPIELDNDRAYIAMCNPEDKEAINKVQSIVNKSIVVIPAKQEQIHSLISTIEDIKNVDFILEQLKKQEDKNDVQEQEPSNSAASISLDSSPIAVVSNHIIAQAIKMKASDIHIEPFEEKVILRYRIDGILQEIRDIPRGFYLAFSSKVKLQAKMNIAEKRIPQDGKMQFICGEATYDLRISTLPTIYGEKVAIRVLYKNEKRISLETLDFNIIGRSNINNYVQSNHGIVLVTGPTGSGKTTTLYAMLNEIDTRHKNVITIEDPVEITMNRVNQVNVNNKAGLTFASGLRSVLRQDPDVVMVGEIRDEETAQIATRAAITGHLVFSTMHTNDAVSSITRLVDMGVPRYLVADSVIACIAQRLVRKICNHCKFEYHANVAEKSSLGFNEETTLFKGKGCIFCNYTGYRGRTVVYEIMQVNNFVSDLINKSKDTEQIRSYCKQNGMITLIDYARELVKLGITTYEEFVKLENVNW